MTDLHQSPAALVGVDWSKADLWGPPRTIKRRGFSPVDVVWSAVWIIVVQVLVSAVAIAAVASNPDTDLLALTQSTPLLVGALLTLWAVFVGYPWFASARHGTSSMAADYGLRFPLGKALAFGVVLGLVLRALSIGATVAADALGLATGENSSWLSVDRALAATVFLLVSTAVIGPAFEEIFFRGFVMKAFLSWRPGRLQGQLTDSRRPAWSSALAVVASSVLFGLMHTTGLDAAGFFVVATTGLVGAVFAMTTLRTGSLAVAIAGHVAFNSSGVLLMLLGVAE